MGIRWYGVLFITALLDEPEAVLAPGEGGKDRWGRTRIATGSSSTFFNFH